MKPGDRVTFQGEPGTLTEVKPPMCCVRLDSSAADFAAFDMNYIGRIVRLSDVRPIAPKAAPPRHVALTALRPIAPGFRARNVPPLRMQAARGYDASAKVEPHEIGEFRNRVFCMDALELLRGLPDGSVDAIIADPPYNLTELDFDQQPINWPAFWSEARRVVKSKRSPIILFSQQPFTTDLINSNRKGFRYEIIWEKSLALGYLDAKKRPLRAHENIVLFADQLPPYYPVMEVSNVTRKSSKRKRGKSAEHYNAEKGNVYVDDNKRYPRSVLKFAQRNTAFKNTETLHPTQKPVALMEWLILTYTKPGDVILDPFAGSGSTGAAARNTGRDYILCENDPKYYATADKRLRQQYTAPMFEQPHPAPGEGAGHERAESTRGAEAR